MAAPPRGYDGGTSLGGTALKLDQLSLLATIVLAFSALAALVLTGQAGIREDMRALQVEMLAGQTELRAEMRAIRAELREEMRAGQEELRKEMRAGQAELRKEMRAGQAELRKEMRAGQAELRKEMQAGQAELRAGQEELRKEIRKEMRAGQAELGAGQVQIREDLAALGTRLAVVEHRADRLESRLAATEQPAAEPCEGADCPGS